MKMEKIETAIAHLYWDKNEWISKKPESKNSCETVPLKEQSHEIFVLCFFLQSAHSGPITDVLGSF